MTCSFYPNAVAASGGTLFYLKFFDRLLFFRLTFHKLEYQFKI